MTLGVNRLVTLNLSLTSDSLLIFDGWGHLVRLDVDESYSVMKIVIDVDSLVQVYVYVVTLTFVSNVRQTGNIPQAMS